MAVTELQIWNQALSALGQTETIAAPDEVSVAAEQCNLWYETVRDAVFSAAPWADLTGFRRLGVVATRDNDADWVATDPPPGWLYAFGLPSDYLRARHLASFARFIPSTVNGARALATNEETPILWYTRREEDPTKWTVDLRFAVVHALAAHIAKAITGNDSDLNNMFTLANENILIARTNDANTGLDTTEHSPDWIQARGGNAYMPTARYVYPSADFTVVGANNLG
jgi:hypothetical protein